MPKSQAPASAPASNVGEGKQGHHEHDNAGHAVVLHAALGLLQQQRCT